ncbi:Acetyltransferase (isoleucine patch superfamily) [Lachnospiraceae bacterium A10]|nr:Acetyltransferase (isoleucine patch superfamily) [Lachnospiraceae bacterium A10]
MNIVLEKRYAFIIENVKKFANGRTVLLWGENEVLKRILNSMGYKVFVVTYVKDKVTDSTFYIEDFAHRSNDYYIVVPFLAFNKRRDDLLKTLGYEEKDRVFFVHEKISIKSESTPIYADNYNNIINCKSDGVSIVLAENVTNCNIEIGENVKGNLNFYITGPSVYIKIGDNVKFKNNYFDINTGATLVIGQKSTFETNTNFHIKNCSEIRIGEDCMFSFGSVLHCGDGHAIFDVETGKRLNPICNKIELGNHVWVGFGASILAPTSIGDDSIVGASSLVKGIFESNSVLAGVPAKVIRKNITWDRSNDRETLYGDYYSI